MSRLNRKTAVVTGASRGIGRGIAKGLAREGAAVGVNHPPADQATAEAETVVTDISEHGGEATTVEADVSERDPVRQMIETIESEFGTIDVLVNNAAVSTSAPVAEMSIEMWDETISVNLRGVFLPTKFALQRMLDEGSGKIINVASQMAFKGDAEIAHYCAAKGGVVSFTRALAREVAPEIQVNAIAPGPIRTGLIETRSEEWITSKVAEVPLERLGEVEDVVPTALFLASEESDFYTGQVLSPDGGDAMH